MLKEIFPHTWKTVCHTLEDIATEPTDGPVNVATNVASGDISADNTITVTLADKLRCGAGNPVDIVLTVGGGGTTPTTAVILDSENAPTYVLGFAASATLDETDLTTSATVACS